ncbi:MAG: hypothetical protein Q8P67_02350 [archaeon]|nr:hypothetical protein [archaeon]
MSNVCNSSGDSEGLLLGKLTKIPYKEREDTQTMWKTSFVVEGSVPTGSACSFYGADGEVAAAKLQALAHGRHVIGWYRFRRGLPLSATVRETSVHHSLCALLGDSSLLFAAFTQVAPEPHLHSFDYKFVQFVDAEPLSLLVNITSMKQSSEDEYASFHPLSSLASFLPSDPSSSLQPSDTVLQLETLVRDSLRQIQSIAEKIHEIRSQSDPLQSEVSNQPNKQNKRTI